MNDKIILKIFNQYPSYLVLDTETGIYIEKQIENKDTAIKFHGISTLIDNMIIGLYSINLQMILQIGKKKWNIGLEELRIRYNHLENGFTQFELICNKNSEYIYEYSSWWNINTEQILPGIDTSPDEDEDFFAYIKMVWADKTMRKNLIDIWEKMGA